jgi:hypothetical protein
MLGRQWRLKLDKEVNKMQERHIGKCHRCKDIFLYEFVFEDKYDETTQNIDIPCPECSCNLEWDFLPKIDKILKESYRVG